MTQSTSVAEPGSAGNPSAESGLSPRQRRRVSLIVQYAILIGAIVLVASVADWSAIKSAFLQSDVAGDTLPGVFTTALKNTVIFTASGYVLGFFLGMLLALMRLSSLPPYRWISLIYIEIFRGLPALLIFAFILFLPAAFPGFNNFPGGIYGQVALGLGVVSAAYMAETLRAGIQAVPRGQMEAARSLGMPYTRAMTSIVIPQALRIVIPPLTNELVMLFKDSSLAFILGVTTATTELTKFGSDSATEHANGTPLLVAGVTYLIITVPLGIVVRRLESRQAKAR